MLTFELPDIEQALLLSWLLSGVDFELALILRLDYCL